MAKKTKEEALLHISKLTREELIDFIKHNDSFYAYVSFAGHTDEQLYDIALRIEEKRHS